MFEKVVIIEHNHIFALGLSSLLKEEMEIEQLDIRDEFHRSILESENKSLIFINSGIYNKNAEQFNIENNNCQLVLIYKSIPKYMVSEGSLIIGKFTHNIALEELRELIYNVNCGKSYVQKDLIATKEGEDLLNNYYLTVREVNIVELILQGLSNIEIAKKMYLSEKTIRNNITQIYKKLKVTSRNQLFYKYNNKHV